MESEFGGDLVTISDDDGNTFMLEHIDTVEIDDIFYMAFLPADMDEDDENLGMVILKVVEEDGEDVLVSVDDDSALEKLHEIFLERLEEDEEPGG